MTLSTFVPHQFGDNTPSLSQKASFLIPCSEMNSFRKKLLETVKNKKDKPISFFLSSYSTIISY